MSGFEKENKENSRRKKLMPLFGVFAFVLLLVAISFYIHSLIYETTDNAFIDGHIIQISPKISGTVLKVCVQDNQKVKKGDLLFEIDPKDYIVRLEQAKASLLSAIAKQKGYKANVSLTSVTSYALLAQAKSGVDYSIQGLESAKYALDIAKNNYYQASSKIMENSADAEKLKADAEAAKADLELAENDYVRYDKLYADGAVSREQLDKAAAKRKTSKAALEAAEKNLKSTEYKIKSAEIAKNSAEKIIKQANYQLIQAKSTVNKAIGVKEQADTTGQNITISKSQYQSLNEEIKQLAAKVKQAELELAYTKIYAPESGQVTKKNAEQGAYVQTGQPLTAIVPNNVWVTANFKENQLKNMKQGQKVTVRIDAFPGKLFKAHVDSFQKGSGSRFSLLPSENAVGSYVKIVQRIPVKIVFDEPVEKLEMLAPGMSVVPKVRVK